MTQMKNYTETVVGLRHVEMSTKIPSIFRRYREVLQLLLLDEVELHGLLVNVR